MKLTKDSEGWSAKLYDDAAGYCTIGYGHLIKKARCDGSELSEFLRGITKLRGAEILAKDMRLAEITVMLEVVPQLSDNQYAAIVDFVFNVGGLNFRTSTLLKRLNESRFDDVPAQLGRWTMANGKWQAVSRACHAAQSRVSSVRGPS
ncbi:lysozyme [Paucibacter sp. AS339]|uniref:lysozyme n=1 Tax=Paucibacter hankyongi TaxID=3133434 RepID=UPI0030AB0827